LARALHECGVRVCYAGVARDFSALDDAAFWAEMGRAGCLWPYTNDGTRLDPPERIASLLPNTVAGEAWWLVCLAAVVGAVGCGGWSCVWRVILLLEKHACFYTLQNNPPFSPPPKKHPQNKPQNKKACATTRTAP
jgi:hypothetical protein